MSLHNQNACTLKMYCVIVYLELLKYVKRGFPIFALICERQS
jgi:hypothetical protein